MSFPERKISRRALGKGAVIAPVVLFLGSEVYKAATGVIHTPHANYYPFYEDHDVGIDFRTRQIPEPWDYHWNEGYLNLSNNTVAEALSLYTDQKRGGVENFKVLASRGVKIATSDIEAPKYTEGLSDLANRLRIFYTSEGITWDLNLHVWGASIFFIRWKYKTLVGAVKKFTGLDLNNPDGNPFVAEIISRTTLLRKMLFTPLDIATGYLFLNTLVGGAWHNIRPEKSDLPVTLDRDQIISRNLNRIQGLLTHTRPNDMVAFFRNLLWADKLSELAEVESKRLGRRINISYEVGMGHGGFEDLLQLGRPITTIILDCYSQDVWRDVVNKNGFDRVTHTTIVSSTDPTRGDDLNSWRHERDVIHSGLASLVTSKIS